MCGGTCPETGLDAFNVFRSILISDADPPSPVQDGPDPPTAPPPGTPIHPGPAPSLPPPQTSTPIISSQSSLQTFMSSTTSSSFEGSTFPATGPAVTFYTSISTLYLLPSGSPSVLSSASSTERISSLPSSNPSTFRAPSASLPTVPVSGSPDGTPSITFVRSGPSETPGVDESFPIPAQVTGSKSSRYDISISIFLILGEALLAVAIMA